MKVNEIFESIQGEGVYIGCNALFIRLQGCNRSCDFCDTKYAKDGSEVDIRKLDAIIRNSPSRHVVFTGGEPMLQQKEIGELIRRVTTVHQKFYEVETNGTIEPVIDPYIHLFTVSPKDDFKIARKFFYIPKVIFKFVIGCREDLEKVRMFVELHVTTTQQVYLMPQTITLAGHRKLLPMLFEFVKKYPEQYRITPRLHVLAYGNRRGR